MTAAAVYMLRCADGSYYIGCTRDENIDYRLAQHNAGFGGSYTKARRPVALVWAEAFERYEDAFAAERRLKGWSRAKKEALIAGDWSTVQWLARNAVERGGSR